MRKSQSHSVLVFHDGKYAVSRQSTLPKAWYCTLVYGKKEISFVNLKLHSDQFTNQIVWLMKSKLMTHRFLTKVDRSKENCRIPHTVSQFSKCPRAMNGFTSQRHMCIIWWSVRISHLLQCPVHSNVFGDPSISNLVHAVSVFLFFKKCFKVSYLTQLKQRLVRGVVNCTGLIQKSISKDGVSHQVLTRFGSTFTR